MVAQGEMESATDALAAPPDPTSQTGAAPDAPSVDFPAARQHQDEALVELAQALELLTPPEQQGDPGEEGDQGEQQQQQQQEQPQQDEEQAQQQASPPADPSQLLQGVRDREAQRRRDREQGRTGYETVEKDW
jgi:hypothetical protein